MPGQTSDPLFTPLKVGQIELKHRIVMAPLTRNRATVPTLAPNDMIAEYYEQRASDGGLLITEVSIVLLAELARAGCGRRRPTGDTSDTQATYPSAESGGYPNTPGLYTDEHVREWKKVTDRVHAKGGFIYTQLWALGRAQGGETGIKVVSSGDVVDDSKSAGGAGGAEKQKPTPLTKEDIKRYQASFADSAKKAVEAGFDGIELHGARE